MKNYDHNNILLKKKLVIKGYAETDIIERYSKVGLWRSENYLISKYFQGRSINNTLKILDLGCGCGRTTIPLKQKGYDVCGIDISPDMISKAKTISKENKLDIDFSVMDASELLFPDNSFDHVLFSYNGIEHIPSIELKKNVLSEVNRVLKQDGYFIFTVHSGIPSIKTFLPWLIRTIDSGKAVSRGEVPAKIEIGERFYNRYVPESTYTQIVPIWYWWKWIKEKGFELVYTNPRIRTRYYKKSSRLHTLFYHLTNFIVIKKIESINEVF